jgi:TRAP-type transport system small permease protein
VVLPVRAERLPRLLRIVGAVEGAAAALLVLTLLVLVVFQVVTRYVLARPFPWTEELARFALIWLAFVGGAWVAAKGTHVAVVLGQHLLGPRARVAVESVAGLLSLAVCGVLLLGAPAFLERVDRTSAPATGLAMGWVYGASVLAYALIAVHTVASIVVMLRHPEEIDRGGRGMDAELAAESVEGTA